MPNGTSPRLAVTRGRTAVDVTAPLLAYLRAALGDVSLEYLSAPAPIFGGFDTLIYGFQLASAPPEYSQPLILRLFRAPADADRAAFEAAAQNAVASLGFPAPRVLIVEPRTEALGAPFTIMQRIPGRVMLEALLGPRMFAMPALLARAHAKLHSLDASDFRRLLGAARNPRRLDTVDAVFERYGESIDAARLEGMRTVFAWLRQHRPPNPARECVCHGDFHPLNVLIAGNEVSGVVDWGWVAIADPAYDVGASAALLTQGPVDIPGFVRPLARLIRRSLLRRYLRAYAAERPLDLDAVRYYEAFRLTGFLLEVGEQMQGVYGVVTEDLQSPFTAPAVRQGIRKRLSAITGIDPRLPDE